MDSIVSEQRVSIKEFLNTDKSVAIPKSAAEVKISGLKADGSQYQNYLNTLCDHWQAPKDVIERGEWIKSHPLTNAIIAGDFKGKTFSEIASTLKISEQILVQFLDLLATARLLSGKRQAPVMPLSVHVWVEETGALQRKLDVTPIFKRIEVEGEPCLLYTSPSPRDS